MSSASQTNVICAVANYAAGLIGARYHCGLGREENEEGTSLLDAVARQQQANNQLADIQTEFFKLGDAYRQRSVGQRKTLYPRFEKAFEQLLNFLERNGGRYFSLENCFREGELAVQKAAINYPLLDSDIKPFLDVLAYLDRPEQKSVLVMANNLAAVHPRRNEITQHLGLKVVQTLIQHPAAEARQKLLTNLQRGLIMFVAVPYEYINERGSYITPSGRFSGNGLDCIGYSNILINLVSGIHQYSPDVDGMTADNMFARKPEFVRAGIRPEPVIDKMPIFPGDEKDLVKLLREYGDFFAVQIYKKDKTPHHIIMVYREGDGYKVTEAKIGDQVVYGENFSSWYRQNASVFGYLSFNLIDPPNPGDFAEEKTSAFMKNLRNGIDRLRATFTNTIVITPGRNYR
jgi:hypothetical protein